MKDLFIYLKCMLAFLLACHQTLFSADSTVERPLLAINPYIPMLEGKTELNLAFGRLDREKISLLIEALRLNHGVKVIYLHCNNLQAPKAHSLKHLLFPDIGLEELYLNNNGIEDSDAIAIAEALGKNNRLRVLAVYHNKMTADGYQAFANMLKHNTSIHDLIYHNDKIDPDTKALIDKQVNLNKNLLVLLWPKASIFLERHQSSFPRLPKELVLEIIKLVIIIFKNE